MSYEVIIGKLKNAPIIWDSSHPSHNSRILVSLEWKRIAEDMKIDEKLLRSRWRNIQDSYKKNLKRVQESADPATQEKHIVWTYYTSLGFLKKEMEIRIKAHKKDAETRQLETANTQRENESSNTQRDNEPCKTKGDNEPLFLYYSSNISDNDDDVIVNNLTNLDNSRIPNVVNVNSRKDPDYLFFMSILPSMKNLTESQNLQFRSKAHSWLLNISTQRKDASTEHGVDEGGKM